MPFFFSCSEKFSYFCSMKLIADSGSTKTDWVLTDDKGGIVVRQSTEGINPFHQHETAIETVLSSVHVPSSIGSVHFYGSGLRPEFKPMMERLLAKRFGTETVEAESDLLGAARALCAHEEGIACILGTGANSCLYNGGEIVRNTPALGYILGDEGSGAVLGRNLLNAIYKGRLPQSLRASFEQEMQLTMADVIRKVYREPLANRWMASLTYFIYRHKQEYDELSQLVVDSFRDFLRVNVLPYGRSDLSVSAIGSIAWFFQTELAHAASLECLRIGRIEQTPMEGLLRYHFPD